MTLWRWNQGRQRSGYDVLPLLISRRLRVDAYLIRLRTGVSVPPHTDPVKPGLRHYRVNLHVGCYAGGQLTNERYLWRALWGRLYAFRPDLSRHSVAVITEGTLYIASIGWARRA